MAKLSKDAAELVVGIAALQGAIGAVGRMIENGSIAPDKAGPLIEGAMTETFDAEKETKATGASGAGTKAGSKKTEEKKTEEGDGAKKDGELSMEDVRNALNRAAESGLTRESLLDVMEEVAGTRKLPEVDKAKYRDLKSRIDAKAEENAKSNDSGW